MKKGIMQIFVGNLIFLVFGVLNNFILPKYLSVDSYAILKTYLLYIGYAAIFAGGYIEGMFLCYGGKTLKEARDLKLGNNFWTFLSFQSILCFIALLIGVLLKSFLLILLVLGVITTNFLNYFRSFSTATGEFKLYSVSVSIDKTLVFLLNALLIFLIKTDNYILYVGSLIFVSTIGNIYFLIQLSRHQPGIFRGVFKLKELTSSISMGITLLLGNSVSTLFAGIDQWFVKFLMTNTEFAMYAFAVSMDRIVVVFITPITTVLYNFFCKENDDSQVEFIREALVLWGFIILLAVFPLIWVVKIFIPQYIDAIDVTAILFCGQALSCVINGVYVNVFKAKKKQNQFLLQMIMMVILSVILNIIAYYVFGNIVSLAYATLLTKIIWLIICQISCKEYKYSINTNIGLVLLIICFITCSLINNTIYGGLLYLFLFIIIGLLFMRDSFFRIIVEIKAYAKLILFHNN